MLTLDLLRLDLSLSLHCMAQLDPITFVMGKGCYGSCLSARSFTTPGFATFAMSLARIDLSPLTLDFVHLELSLFLQSSAWSGFSLFALDLLHMDLLMLPRCMGNAGLSFPAFSRSQLGSSTFVLDFLRPESGPSLQSFARLDSALSVLDPLHLGPPTLAKSLCHTGPIAFFFGLTCTDFVFSLSVIDSTSLAFSSSAHSSACPDLLALILDFLKLGLPLFTQSSACCDSMLFISGMTKTGLFMPLLDLAKASSLLFLQSSSCLGSVLFALDLLHPDFAMLVHSLVCLGLVVPALDFLRLDSFMLLRSLTHLAFVVFVSGMG